MDAIKLVQDFIAAFEAADMERAGSYLTDDFVLTGPTPMPQPKAAALGLAQALKTAFPDWTFHARQYGEDGNQVSFETEITGTHTGPLRVPGIPEVVATGETIRQPVERQIFTVRNGKIVSWHVMAPPDGGMPGVLKQLGVPAPGASN